MNPTTLANLGALAGDLYGQLAAALEQLSTANARIAEFESGPSSEPDDKKTAARRGASS